MRALVQFVLDDGKDHLGEVGVFAIRQMVLKDGKVVFLDDFGTKAVFSSVSRPDDYFPLFGLFYYGSNLVGLDAGRVSGEVFGMEDGQFHFQFYSLLFCGLLSIWAP